MALKTDLKVWYDSLGSLSLAQSWWSRQRGFNVPSTSDSIRNNALMNACEFSPLRLSLCLAAKCKKTIGSRVSHLCCTGNPAAIAFAIISVVVDAIKCRSFRPFSHVLEKIIKLQPSLAHANPTASVLLVVFVIFVVASLKHSCPNAIDRLSGHAMPWPASTSDCICTCAAPCRNAASQITARTWPNKTARTSAFPHRPVIGRYANVFQYCPFTKNFTRNVDDVRHENTVVVKSPEVKEVM